MSSAAASRRCQLAQRCARWSGTAGSDELREAAPWERDELRDGPAVVGDDHDLAGDCRSDDRRRVLLECPHTDLTHCATS